MFAEDGGAHYGPSDSFCDGYSWQCSLKQHKQNMFGEEGGAEIDPDGVSGSDSDCLEESVEEVNEPNTSRGCGCWRKMQCSGSCGVVGGEDNNAVEEQVWGNYIFMLLVLLCDSISG